MMRDKKQVLVGNIIVLLLLLINGIIVRTAYIGNSNWYWVLLIFVPLLLLAIFTIRQKGRYRLLHFPLTGK
jgi:hypothetical protein